jgi:hypothetical protein
MSDFQQDASEACNAFTEWCDRNPDNTISNDDFAKINSLIQKYGDDRDTYFQGMLKDLENLDEGSPDTWQQICERGTSRLGDLDSAIPRNVGDGLSGIGLRDFSENEKKLWAKNSESTIAIMAWKIRTAELGNDALGQKMAKDLEDAKSAGMDAAQGIKQIIAEHNGAANFVIHKVGETVADYLSTKIPKPLLELSAQIGGTENKLEDGFKKKVSASVQAAQLQKYKTILLDNWKSMKDAQKILSLDAIKDAIDKAASCSSDLQGIRSGSYNAADWSKFAKQCEQRLVEISARAIGKAQYLSGEVVPNYKEATRRAFFSQSLKDAISGGKNDLDQAMGNVFAQLKADLEVQATLRDNEAKARASEQLREMESGLRESWQDYKKDLEDFLEDQNFGNNFS